MANKRISDMTAAGSLTGSEVVPVLQSGSNRRTTTQAIADLASGGAGYLVYTALLTQTGTDAPVATVLENTLGGTVVWGYVSSSVYSATLAGAFTTGKTVFPVVSIVGTAASDTGWSIISEDQLQLQAASDSAINNWLYEIRVYP